ncbi:MAG: hypothetical protein V9H26_21185 [Verrucomicrobiota bacterium]
MKTKINAVASMVALAILEILLSGCKTGHMTIPEATKPQALEPIRTANAEMPVKVVVVNFAIKSVENDSDNVDTESLRRNLALAVPNRLCGSLGGRRVFSEVSRASSAEPGSADFIVSGDYEIALRSGKGFGTHYASVKGTMSVRVVEVKTGNQVFQKTYVEEHKDKTTGQNRARVTWLQSAHVAEITADIKAAIYAARGKPL